MEGKGKDGYQKARYAKRVLGKSSAVTHLMDRKGRKRHRPVTSSGDDHTQRSRLEAGCGDAHRAAPLDRGHHSGVEGEGAGHHRDPRRDGVGVGSPQCVAEVVFAVHSHHGRSNPGGEEWVTVPDSDPGGCIHEVQGIFGHSHP